jgi:uncharacterized protein YjiS (DUF1127 family)
MFPLFEGTFRLWRYRRRARPWLARADALSDRELRDIGLLRTHRPDGRIVRAP